jgi:hypothetical protein
MAFKILMNTRFLNIVFLIAIPAISIAQRQERELLFYNVGFGALTGGIGATINKPKTLNWKRAFITGFWQGSIGGLLTFSGKKSLHLVNRNKTLAYAWPAKIIHAAGISIIENAAARQPFLENWNINIGIARFDFSLGDKKCVKARFLPYSIYSVISGFVGGSFDASTSLQTGNLAFKYKSPSSPWQGNSSGISFGRTFAYENSTDKYYFISHELVHQFQFDEYQSLNALLLPLGKKVKSTKVQILFSKYIYFDVPYLSLAYYGIEGTHDYPNYYRNFYEFEAERFSTNAHVHK